MIGNYIGTATSGTRSIPNRQHGVVVNEASNNTIGGQSSADGNLISGNNGIGVVIENSPASGNGLSSGVGVRVLAGANGNVIAGNYIGTNSAGTAGLGNVSDGISIAGNSTLVLTNVVSGNEVTGIRVISSRNTVIQGNYVGTDQSGVFGIGNAGIGLLVGNFADGTTIGGPDANEGNIIAGNGGDGVHDAGTNTSTMMAWNKVGENINGEQLPNGGKGASLNGTGDVIANNFFSYNPDGGLDLTGDNNIVSSNTVDDNGGEGIVLHSGNEDHIYLNLIYNNGGDGLFLDTGVINARADFNQIGVDQNGNAAGNAGNGVVINDSGNDFGGNTIWYNYAEGIVVLAGTGNELVGNSIYLNRGLGIDLGGNGIYPIHSQPLDGPNLYENYPTLTAVSIQSGMVYVSGIIDTRPNTYGRVVIFMDLFQSQTPDPSGYGQGQHEVGYGTTVDVAMGRVHFTVGAPWDPSMGTWFTVLATPIPRIGVPPDYAPDLYCTSEFSNAVQVSTTTSGNRVSDGAGSDARNEFLVNSESSGDTAGGAEPALGPVRVTTESCLVLIGGGAPASPARVSGLVSGTSSAAALPTHSSNPSSRIWPGRSAGRSRGVGSPRRAGDGNTCSLDFFPDDGCFEP